MEDILNGVNGQTVPKLAEVVYNGSHEIVPTRNQRVMENLQGTRTWSCRADKSM